MKTTIRLITIALTGLIAAALAGCAASANLKSPPPGHIVQTIGSVKQLGIGANQTATATLGYQSGMVDVLTTPVQLVTNASGDQKYVTPNIVITYEIKGQQNNALIGGSAGSSLTVAIGDIGAQTWAGGQHLLINAITNQPTPPGILIPAPFKGSNTVSTVSTNQ